MWAVAVFCMIFHQALSALECGVALSDSRLNQCQLQRAGPRAPKVRCRVSSGGDIDCVGLPESSSTSPWKAAGCGQRPNG